MDKIVVCPECGAQMTLQDGQVVFSCVDCGTRLFCIKGVVITKSQAKILLTNSLVAISLISAIFIIN